MHVHVDHEEVRDAEDRTWTLPLLELAADPATDDDDRLEIFETLRQLEDYRAVGPLTAMLENRTLPEAWRNAASDALRSTDDATTAAKVRAWWAGGDGPLRRHALLSMYRDEADVVLRVASDPNHPQHATAIYSMSHGFDGAEFVPAMLAGLEHPDPEVREFAAEVLMWNEPVAAEFPLLRAAHDEVTDVAVEALYALEYFPTRRVLRALSELREELDDEEAREQADTSFDDVRGTFEQHARFALKHADGGASLKAWMEPVADLITWPDEPDLPTPVLRPEPPAGEPISEADLNALIDEPGGSWRDKRSRYHGIDWARFDDGERDRIGARLTGHPDPDIRWFAALALAAWSRTAELVALLADPGSSVRKSAAYHLVETPPDPSASEPLWTHMMGQTGTMAREALASYAHHAPADEAVARFEALVRDDPREELRSHAVDELVKSGAADSIDRLTPLLSEPPGVTWVLHASLIEARRKVGLPCPDLSHLEFVDDVYLMSTMLESLAERNA